MPKLRELEGKRIQAAIRFFNKDDRSEVKEYVLHSVEESGIWVENQEFTEKIFKAAEVKTAPRTFVAFVPWSEIAVVFGSVKIPSLSDTLLE
jgi:hypothetical protein